MFVATILSRRSLSNFGLSFIQSRSLLFFFCNSLCVCVGGCVGVFIYNIFVVQLLSHV